MNVLAKHRRPEPKAALCHKAGRGRLFGKLTHETSTGHVFCTGGGLRGIVPATELKGFRRVNTAVGRDSIRAESVRVPKQAAPANFVELRRRRAFTVDRRLGHVQ